MHNEESSKLCLGHRSSSVNLSRNQLFQVEPPIQSPKNHEITNMLWTKVAQKGVVCAGLEFIPMNIC